METSGWIGLAILVTFSVVSLYLTIRRRMPTLDRPEDRVSTAALADVEQNRRPELIELGRWWRRTE